jgi:polygalacturonase
MTTATTTATVLGSLRMPPSTSSDNSHTFHVTRGKTIPVLNIVPRADWVNVKKMGAKGDGKTDDTAAIQRAIDTLVDTPYGCNMPGACSNATKTLYFPPGTWVVEEPCGTVILAG